jgi:hypothetical protein
MFLKEENKPWFEEKNPCYVVVKSRKLDITYNNIPCN